MSLTYETIFIVPADQSPQKLDDFVEKLKNFITQKGGEIVLLDKWGRRRLAYPIKRQREGFYVFLQFKAPGPLLAELNQFFRVSEDIIRFIICKALKGKPASPTMSFPAPGVAAVPAVAAPVVAASPAAKEVSLEQPAPSTPA